MEQITLDRPIPRRYHDEVLKNLSWIDQALDGVDFDPADEGVIRFSYKKGPAPAKVVARLKEAAERLGRSCQLIPEKVIFSQTAEVPGCVQPYERLLEKGWLRQAGTGFHTYHGLMSQLYHALEAWFRDMSLAMGVGELKFPTLVSLDDLRKAGYLEGFPHNVNFVSHLPEQYEAIEDFKAELARSGDVRVAQSCQHALCPAVCYHFYGSHRGWRLDGPLVGGTAQSACYRYEGKAMSGLRRLREYNMREIMFMGEAQQVLTRRDSLLELMKDAMKVCGLRGQIRNACDPFFLDDYDKKRIYQMSFDLKYEVQAWLPDEGTWLAIGSVNYHQNHFGRAFSILTQGGEQAHSCCLGFGIDRWCLAVFAQYGVEETAWPEGLQRILRSYRECAGGTQRGGHS